MTSRRSADTLRDVPDPAWPHVERLVAESPYAVSVLPADPSRRDVALEALQVTTGSVLGAIVGECGALLVDHGWLRILGAGVPGLPGVHEASRVAGTAPPVLECAWDVVGGRFAVNGGGLDAPPGEVCYWGPDTLGWVPIGGGHSSFVAWALSGGLDDFYASLRWPGWQSEVEPLAPSEGISAWPPPFTAEGSDLGRSSRAVVPLAELHDTYAELAQQLHDVPDDSSFTVRVTDEEVTSMRPDVTTVEIVGGPEKRELVLRPYDPAWAAAFATHERLIRTALGSAAVQVEHIGSTSVPGLAAKPIIDVLLTVHDVAAERDYLPALLDAGYLLRVREPGHRLVRTPELDVHVHVMSAGAEAAEDYLLFRDRLRAEPAERELYESTKRALVEQDWPDMNAYADAKTEVVIAIKERARAARQG